MRTPDVIRLLTIPVLVVSAMCESVVMAEPPALDEAESSFGAVLVEPSKLPLIESPALTPSASSVPEGRFGATDATAAPEPVRELVDERTASSDSWLNTDGTQSVRTFSTPQYFQAVGSSEWQPIETKVASDDRDPERLRSGANRWGVSFGASDSRDGMLRFELEEGAVSFAPITTGTPVKPVADGSTVTFEELWPATDAVYTVSAVGVDERLVLRNPTVASEFGFEVTGATPRSAKNGGIDLFIGDRLVASVPPLTIETASRWIDPTEAGATLSAVTSESGDGGQISVAIDGSWLAKLPDSAFPVVIDPTVQPIGTPGSADMRTVYQGSGTIQTGWLKAGMNQRCSDRDPRCICRT